MQEAVIGEKSNDPFRSYSICGPTDGLDIRVIIFAHQGGLGSLGIGFFDPLVHNLILAILVVVIFVYLTSVVRRIAENNEYGGFFLLFNSFEILLHKKGTIRLAFGQLEGVHQAEACKGFIMAGEVVILVLEVHGGDVVRQEHDFVGVEFAGVFALQLVLGDFTHDPQEKVAGAHKGIQDMDVFIPERAAKFPFQDFVHRAHHEIDQGLGGVHNAVGVGHPDGEALEKALIDGVQEGLLLRIVLHEGGGGFDGDIEAVQGF
jgi:hypothetical protein